MPKFILGISAYYHDSAAAILCDVEIIAAAQEESFTRKKYDDEFPRNAHRYVLEEAGIEYNELSAILFYDKPFMKRKLRNELKFFGKEKIPLLFPEHHISHAASAFFPSPFEEAAILTIDGVGEWATCTI